MELCEVLKFFNVFNFPNFVVAYIKDLQSGQSLQIFHFAQSISGQIQLSKACQCLQPLNLFNPVERKVHEDKLA